MSALAQLWVPVAALLAMVALSAVAAFRLPADARVPMQWGLGGKPTWTAPVWLAVSYTPVLATIVYALTIVGAAAAPSPLIETLVSIRTILSIEGVLFLVIHALHLFFATRHVVSGR